MDPHEKLSPHFALGEFLHEGVTEVPPNVLANLKKLANALELVRKQCGDRPISINSGYRTPEHNRKVGGEKNSFHLKGLAADIVVHGLPASKVQAVLRDWPGGLGSYDTFTHIDVRGYYARWKG